MECGLGLYATINLNHSMINTWEGVETYMLLKRKKEKQPNMIVNTYVLLAIEQN
jgi:hypothetical protein